MKVVIVEDEKIIATDLAHTLSHVSDNVEIIKILSSVTEAVNFFKTNNLPDLIFSDIQLGDGNSFDIFKEVKMDVPVIFCTAYNEFALESFKNNGIDYILKPFTKKTVKNSLEKYNNLRARFSNTSNGYENLVHDLHKKMNRETSLLVNWKDKIIPLKIKDVALFNIDFKATQAITFDNRKYFINQTLEELEEICGQEFYRANRQCLVNREAVAEAAQHYARKLLLKLKIENDHEIIISKNKVPEFLNWLKGGDG